MFNRDSEIFPVAGELAEPRQKCLKMRIAGLQGVDEQKLLDLIRYGLTSRIQFKRQAATANAE